MIIAIVETKQSSVQTLIVKFLQIRTKKSQNRWKWNTSAVESDFTDFKNYTQFVVYIILDKNHRIETAALFIKSWNHIALVRCF